MVVHEYTGEFVPSSLQAQLAAAGIDVLGVTCVDGEAPSVQVICTDDTDEATLAAAVAAYAAPVPSSIATAADHAAVSAGLITEKLASVPVPRDDLKAILQALLGQAADAIPFFEQYALDPSMTAQQWTDFQQLDQATKDRLLYDVVRSMAAVMRYLTGDLPT